MRFITTKTHGIMDYIMGLLLIISPWLFGFARGGAETWVPVVLGLGIIAYSAMTDYEYGAVRQISMKTHLWLDGLGGLLLAASPWLFGFSEYVFWPHLILGLLEIGAALTTHISPAIETVDEHKERESKRTFGENAYSRNRSTSTAHASAAGAASTKTQVQPTASASNKGAQSINNAASPQAKSNLHINSTAKNNSASPSTSPNNNRADRNTSPQQQQQNSQAQNSTSNPDTRNKQTVAGSANTSRPNSISEQPSRTFESGRNSSPQSGGGEASSAQNPNKGQQQQPNNKQTFVQNERRNQTAQTDREGTQNPTPNRNRPNTNNPDPRISPDRGSAAQTPNSRNPNRDTESSNS